MGSFKTFIIISIVYIMFGCARYPQNLDQLSGYVRDRENGLTVCSGKNNFEFELQYIPAELTASKEFTAQISNVPLDSLIDVYRKCRSFEFTIQSENIAGNILNYKSNSTDELKKRQYEMDFHFGDHFSLDIDGNKFFPQLCSAQNVSIGGHSGIKVELIFVAETEDSPLLQDKDLSLYFEDPFFETGVTCFTIKDKDIQKIPQLKKL